MSNTRLFTNMKFQMNVWALSSDLNARVLKWDFEDLAEKDGLGRFECRTRAEDDPNIVEMHELGLDY